MFRNPPENSTRCDRLNGYATVPPTSRLVCRKSTKSSRSTVCPLNSPSDTWKYPDRNGTCCAMTPQFRRRTSFWYPTRAAMSLKLPFTCRPVASLCPPSMSLQNREAPPPMKVPNRSAPTARVGCPMKSRLSFGLYRRDS